MKNVNEESPYTRKTTRNMLEKLLFALILMLFASACGNHEKKEFKEGLLCRCTVFPTGMLSETYQINVYEDGTICTYFGSRNEDFDSLARRGKVMEEQIFEKTETKKTGKLKTELNRGRFSVHKFLSERFGGYWEKLYFCTKRLRLYRSGLEFK